MRLSSIRSFVNIAAIAGIAACLIDIGGTCILGSRIEGYSQVKQTMSQLGITTSPVAAEISFCWMAMGILMIIFGAGIRIAHPEKKKLANLAFLILVLYGIGEGMSSAIFPADRAGLIHSWTGIVHNGIGGVGVVAIMVLPVIVPKLIPGIDRISAIVLYAGAIGVLMFAISHILSRPGDLIAIYKGSYQRFYVMVYYAYLIIVAVKMMQRRAP